MANRKLNKYLNPGLDFNNIFFHLFINWMAISTSLIFNIPLLQTQEKFLPPQCIHIIQEDGEGRKFSFPSRLFYEPVKDEIYLIESGHSRILIYTSDFFPIFTLDKDNGILNPVCLSVDPEGYLFVGQSRSSAYPQARISVFNPCLKWKRDIHFAGFEGAEEFMPRNISLDEGGRIYLAGSNNIGIVILDQKGKYLASLKPEDEFMGIKKKVTIYDVEIDIKGNIYLLSEEAGRVYVYDKNWKFLIKFGEKGGSSAKLSRPRGLEVDSIKNRAYVIDYMRHTANVYNAETGKYLFEFGGRGWGKGWFQFPTDICVDKKGNVLVADTFNDRVQVLEMR